jgi:Restriction Enzyme Adenine Methylase Associated
MLVQTLIDEGLLWPGEDVLSVDYKQQQTLASLTPDGKIASSSKFAPWRNGAGQAPVAHCLASVVELSAPSV